MNCNMKKLLIVDDDFVNRALLKKFLEDRYEILEAVNGKDALEIIDKYQTQISMVLLDMVMPEMGGFEVLEYMNEFLYIPTIPVMCITGDTTSGKEEKAFSLGVADFIPKPFNISVVRKRIENVIDLYERTNNLEEMVEEQTAEIYAQTEMINEQARIAAQNSNILIEGLSTVVEFRSAESGEHIKRIRSLTEILYRCLKEQHPEYEIKDDDIDLVSRASVLHDIGKIAIPDVILLKPGRFTDQEYEVMKRHSKAGLKILNKFSGFSDVKFLDCAKEICVHHHERIDGSGYPDGLKGDAIPLFVQVVSVADVYDALVSPRIYKKSYSHEKANEMIFNGDCGKFSDELMNALKVSIEDIRRIYE